MNKILVAILAISIVTTGCVSRKKYVRDFKEGLWSH